MPQMPEQDVWTMALSLTTYNSKAFLGTILKSLACTPFHIYSDGSQAFLTYISKNPIDTQKTLQRLLPILNNPEEIQWIFNKLKVEDGEPRIPYLMRSPTMAMSFVLLRTLKYVEHNHALLVRVTYYLIKQGDGLSFNLASLLKSYFGLEEVKGTFSLNLEPYHLARIEGNYDAFCEVVRR